MFCWRASGRLDLASEWLQAKASPSVVFTFASGDPCKWVLSVVRIRWAVRTGSEWELSIVHIQWAVRTGIEHWLFVTCVRTLLLTVRMVFRENRLIWAVKSSKFILSFFGRYIALFNPFLSWSIVLLSHFHSLSIAVKPFPLLIKYSAIRSYRITVSLIRQCFYWQNVTNKIN
jgi:hypothetical protein